MDVFVGRERELEALAKRADARGGQLVLVWGRRRIGKSYLLQRFAAVRDALFYTATQQATEIELNRFTENARALLGDAGLPPGYVFPSWETALNFLAERNPFKRFVVILDEFPYIVASSPGLESVLQQWWDRVGRASNVMLILCGSAQTFMRSLDDRSAPLHQRATGKLEVAPFDYRDASLLVPSASPSDKAVAYGVLGGTPLYVEQWDASAGVRENLLNLFADPASTLVDAAEVALSGELSEAEGSLRIMQAVAAGKTRASEIKDYAKVTVERPLKRLVSLQLLERRVPALEDPLKTRRAYYRIVDPYFRFYFRFISSGRGDIGRGLGRRLIEHVILPRMNDFMGSVYEDMARSHARMLAASDIVSADHIDSWWDSDGSTEIDLVGTRAKHVTLVGSAKWNEHPAKMQVLADLERQAAALPVDATNAERIIYARGGADQRLCSLSNVRVVDIAEMYA